MGGSGVEGTGNGLGLGFLHGWSSEGRRGGAVAGGGRGGGGAGGGSAGGKAFGGVRHQRMSGEHCRDEHSQ